jgi:hypothetical protein
LKRFNRVVAATIWRLARTGQPVAESESGGLSFVPDVRGQV